MAKIAPLRKCAKTDFWDKIFISQHFLNIVVDFFEQCPRGHENVKKLTLTFVLGGKISTPRRQVALLHRLYHLKMKNNIKIKLPKIGNIYQNNYIFFLKIAFLLFTLNAPRSLSNFRDEIETQAIFQNSTIHTSFTQLVYIHIANSYSLYTHTN